MALGEHDGVDGPSVLACHRARVGLEEQRGGRGGRCGRRRPQTARLRVATQLKVEVGDAAIVDAAKEARYERAADRVVACGAAATLLVEHVAYAQLGVLVEELFF